MQTYKGDCKNKKDKEFIREFQWSWKSSYYSEDKPKLEDEGDDYEGVDPKNFSTFKSLPEEGDFIVIEFQVKGIM